MPATITDYPTDLGEIADILDRAALLIEHDGLEVGDWWWKGSRQYEPGTSVDATGAIGVAAGYTTHAEIERRVAGVCYPDATRHPAFVALMDHLCCVHPEQVFDWSDQARDDQVVARIRMCSAELRVIEADHELIERIRLDESIAPQDRLITMLRAWRVSVMSA